MDALVWQEEPAVSGAFPVAQGGRYAVLASVSRNYSGAQIESYLAAHGWTVTYLWEQGAPTRAAFAIDDWLAGLAPDPTDNHRWVYGEGNRTGPSAALSGSAPWPFTFFRIAHVFRAVLAPASAPAPELPPASPGGPLAASSGPSPGALVVAGGAVAIGAALLWWLL